MIGEEVKATAAESPTITKTAVLAMGLTDYYKSSSLNSTPKFYPNNTLIADLNKCHSNIGHLFCWPQTSRATATTLSGIRSCWPRLQAGARPRRLGSYSTKSTRYSFLMPESLLRTNAKLKSEDYDKALSMLTSDVRYQLHLLLYRRLQTIWILLSTVLCILAPVLLSNLESLIILVASLTWISLQVIGAFVSIQVRQKLDQMLEKSVAQVNTFFMDYNLMLGVINDGSLLSKAKLIIPMLYFDTSQCREQIESIISIDSRKDADGNNDNKHILDYSRIDLPLTKPNAMALAQSPPPEGSLVVATRTNLLLTLFPNHRPAVVSNYRVPTYLLFGEQQLAKKIVLRYSQRWISYFDKRKLMFTDDQVRPRHLSTGKCLCQFIEEHFKNNATNSDSKHQQQKRIENKTKSHNQSNISSYANNKPPILVLNGKQQQQQQHQDEQVEPRVRPQVVRKYAQMAPIIPTLSRLVSSKENSNQQIRIDMNPNQQSAPSVDALNHHHNHNHHHHHNNNHHHQHHHNHHHNHSDQQPANGGCQVNGFAKHLCSLPSQATSLQQTDDANTNGYHISTSQNNLDQSQSPSGINQSPTSDVSLDLGSELLGNGDDLVKRLRLLLEMRKNELQGLDGSLFSAALYKLSNQCGFLEGVGDSNQQNHDPQNDENRDTFPSETNTTTSTTKSTTTNASHVTGRKFFSQRDGFFFFGVNNVKKSQQQLANRTNQVLEIC